MLGPTISFPFQNYMFAITHQDYAGQLWSHRLVNDGAKMKLMQRLWPPLQSESCYERLAELDLLFWVNTASVSSY